MGWGQGTTVTGKAKSKKAMCGRRTKDMWKCTSSDNHLYTKEKKKQITILSQTLLMDKKYSPKITVGGTKNSCNMSNL